MDELIFDADDTDLLADFRWYKNNRGLYYRVWIINEKRKQEYAHRIIAERILFATQQRVLRQSDKVSHWNRVGHDNRRTNIRIETASEVQQRARRRRGIYTSDHHGVYWNRRRNCYQVHITYSIGTNEMGQNISITEYLGQFRREEQEAAARAYDARAREVYAHPLLNFPDETP